MQPPIVSLRREPRMMWTKNGVRERVNEPLSEEEVSGNPLSIVEIPERSNYYVEVCTLIRPLT